MPYVFNPFTGTLDYTVSAGTAPVPIVVASGVTLAVADNQQLLYTIPLYVQAGGVVATSGSGVLGFVQ